MQIIFQANKKLVQIRQTSYDILYFLKILVKARQQVDGLHVGIVV